MIQNADISVVLTLQDSASTAIDPTTISDYEFYVYRLYAGEKVLLATYKKSNTGLYGVAYDAILDTYTIIINRELTAPVARTPELQ